MSDSRQRGAHSGRATKNQEKQAFLTQGNLARHIFLLSWPTVLGLFGIFLFNLADVFFVGKLGTIPLAAISFVFPLLFAFITLSIALGIATTALVAQALGAGKKKEALMLGNSALLLAFIYGSILSLIGIATIKPIFQAMGATNETLSLITTYMQIWYVSAPMLTILIVSNHILRAHAIAIFPGLGMLAASIINIILDPILIFGLMGVPRLEIAGAAWATLIARAIGCLLMLYGLQKYRILGKMRKNLKELKRDFANICKFALPASGQNIVQPLTEIYVVVLLAQFGTAAVATYGVVTRIYSIIFLPYYALSIALIPIVAQNWGGTHRARVDEAGRLAVKVALLWGGLCVIPLFYFSPNIAKAFGESENFIAWTIFYFRYVPWSFTFAGIVMLLGAFFYGIARPFYAFSTEVVHWFILYLPIAFITAKTFAVYGILLSETFANISAALLAFSVYRLVRKRGF